MALVDDTLAPETSVTVANDAPGASPLPLLLDSIGTPTLVVDQIVQIQAHAADNVGVASLTAEVDGVAVELSELGTFLYTATQPGIPVVTVTAIDEAGNVGTSVTEPELEQVSGPEV